jgi:hypothetical protein
LDSRWISNGQSIASSSRKKSEQSNSRHSINYAAPALTVKGEKLTENYITYLQQLRSGRTSWNK